MGQTAPIVNSGIVDNRGIEFQLGWDGRIGQHFRYWIRPNFTFARNKVKFCNEISYIDNNGRDCPWRYQTGRRVRISATSSITSSPTRTKPIA